MKLRGFLKKCPLSKKCVFGGEKLSGGGEVEPPDEGEGPRGPEGPPAPPRDPDGRGARAVAGLSGRFCQAVTRSCVR